MKLKPVISGFLFGAFAVFALLSMLAIGEDYAGVKISSWKLTRCQVVVEGDAGTLIAISPQVALFHMNESKFGTTAALYFDLGDASSAVVDTERTLGFSQYAVSSVSC